MVARKRARIFGGHGGPPHYPKISAFCLEFCRRSCPVISGGFSSPNIPSRVGATSDKVPPLFSWPLYLLSNKIKGTGYVVCAVCSCPVLGSAMNSALP